MEALPGGMGSMMSGLMGPGADSGAQFKRFCVIMQSMTKAELDCEVPLDHPRLLRIARGAGVHPNQVVQLIQAHKQMEKMVGGMSKAGLLKGGDEALATKMKRNPNAVMQQLSRSMDPRMLQSMGGAGNFMSMLKGLAGGGGPGAGAGGLPPGMPAGLGDMMKGMQGMMKGMGFG
jgi:signal recognition particle subunit SRP54